MHGQQGADWRLEGWMQGLWARKPAIKTSNNVLRRQGNCCCVGGACAVEAPVWCYGTDTNSGSLPSMQGRYDTN